jgi:nucleoside-diphosphate-sugar epimerase
MHVFVTGGSGLTGPAVVSELIAAGHVVTGLARSDKAELRLHGLGARVIRGALEDVEPLRAGAERADAVLHMAFGGDFADPDDLIRRDRSAIEALGGALVGSGKPFVSTSGTLVMTPGRVTTENDPADTGSIGAFRIPGEAACLGFATRGVRSSVVRLAPTVHGPHDIGFIPMLVATARRTGVSAYIGDGSNRWPAVHRLDAATLFRLALEKAPAGTVWHGAAESGVTLKSIAEMIGDKLRLPVRSVSAAEAPGHFGNPFFARVFGIDAPVSSERTRAELGWKPSHATLLDDLAHGDYFTEAAYSAFAGSRHS